MYLIFTNSSKEMEYTSWDQGQWAAPEVIRPVAGDYYYKDIAADSAGNIHVVFDEMQESPFSRAIQYMSFNGTEWSEPEKVSFGEDGFDKIPTLSISEAGAPQVVWYMGMTYTEDSRLLYRQRLDQGWSGAVQLNTPSSNPEYAGINSVSAAISTGNVLHLVWQAVYNGCSEVYYAAASISASDLVNPGAIAVPATDPDGNYSVTWGPSPTEGVAYVLEEATDSAFTEGLRTAYTGTEPGADISGREIGTTYYYRVKAVKPGFADSGWTLGANGCEVSLGPGGSSCVVSGRVTVNNLPAGWTYGESTICFSDGVHPDVGVQTDADGNYSAALFPSTYEVRLGSNWWNYNGGEYIGISYSAHSNFSVSSDAVLDIVVPTVLLSGVVYDSNGSPVPDTRVECYYDGGSSYWTTSADGSFKLLLLPGTHTLTVRPPAALYPPFYLQDVSFLDNTVRNIILGVLPLSPVPDTGQTQCYDAAGNVIPCPQPGEAFYGQDGNYTINPPSYTKLDASGNDLPESAESWAMVRDNVTGLVWEVKQNKDEIQDYTNPHDADNTYTWYDSNPATNGGYAGTPGDGTDTEDFIAALNAENFGGYSDWRLPTPRELSSIENYGRYNPTINRDFFPDTQPSDYWSSTTFVANFVPNFTEVAWFVAFKYSGSSDMLKSDSFFVRAVRGGQTSNHFVDNGDGTVTDTATGLMWQQTTAPGTYTWQEALSYCEGLSLAGHTDWRLPTINELGSIVDLAEFIPSINRDFFPDTQPSYYWSSTTNTDPYNTVCASSMDFCYGHEYNWRGKSNSDFVRAVRSVKSGWLDDPVIGDLNGNGEVNLTDAILALQVVVGANPSAIRSDYAASGADVDGDGKIGLAEAIYALQKTAGLR